MRKSRRSVKQPVIESSSEDEALIPKSRQSDEIKPVKTKHYSSSESDIENYLQPISKIDLSSSFFSLSKKTIEGEKLEATNAHISRLTDSSFDENSDENDTISELQKKDESHQISTNSFKMGFQHMEEFKKKIEETKKHVEEYNKKKEIQNIEASEEIQNPKSEPTLDLGISDLLALGETKKVLNLDNISKEDLHPSDFESSDEDWEEVKIKENQEAKDVKTIPKESIQITVDAMPNNVKKKKAVDFLAAMKRRLNRIRKENQVYVHKVQLLCWIAHGNYVNMIINNNDILSQALTLLPSEKSYPSDRTDLGYLEKIVQWYKKTIVIIDKSAPNKLDLISCLQLQIARKQAFNNKMCVLIFVAILRALGIQTRLVMSFQVEPLRPPASELHSLAMENPKSNKTKSKVASTNKKTEVSTSNIDKTPKIDEKINGKKLTLNNGKKDKKNQVNVQNTKTTSNKTKENKNKKPTNNNAVSMKNVTNKSTTKRTAGKASKELRIKMPRLENLKKIPQVDGLHDSTDSCDEDLITHSINILQVDGPGDVKKSSKKVNFNKLSKIDNQKPSINERKTQNSKISPPKTRGSLKGTPSKIVNSDTEDSEDEFISSSTSLSKSKKNHKYAPKGQLDVKNDVINLIKGRIAEQRHIDQSRKVKKRKPVYAESDSDSDYAPEPIKKKHHDSDSDKDHFIPKTKVKKRIRVKKEGDKLKVISSESDLDESGKKKRKGVNVWIEVFLEAEEKWICADVVKGQVHCVNEIYARATHPISYIVAWKNDNSLKDVTRRYCKNFSTVTRKLRVDPKWWEESLRPFIGPQTIRDKEEDDDLNRQQLDQPMPKAISEYKNHPLYALKRHLLKFEAMYPDDQVPLGYVRGEAVYPRNSVYVCKSRDIWLKEALVVKPGEKPYKIVKARPKYDKLSNTVITDQLLEIFGPWQTMDYEPPTAENGVVPRNAFGNVELFKACMLPKGTVHIKLAGLNKVCKKLHIDCASAIVGFDFHGGWSHPVYDGFVICEEFADQVIAAWELEQEEIERKENEKIEQRVYGNWKKLIKGLLIRDRLKAKYNFGSPSKESKNKKEKTKKSRASKNQQKSSSSEGEWEDME